MANYKAQAINLKSYNLGESDRIMLMYSREHGLIRCVAKGAKKTGSSLGGKMQLFVANNILFATGRNLDIVCQAEVIESFSNIQSDMTKLIYSFYIVELINNFAVENDPNCSKIYDITFEALKNISILNSLEEILWTIIRFKLRLMDAVGYATETDFCVRCCTPESNFGGFHYFSPECGGIVCKSCSDKASKTLEIDKRHLHIFRDANDFEFPDEDLHFDKYLLYSCFNALKEFVSVRSDKKLKTPEMIEALC